MICNGWRSVFVENTSDLSLDCGCLNIKKSTGENASIPMNQISRIIVSSQNGSISIPLINALMKHNICIIFCNESHSPSCEVLNLGAHTYAAGRHIEQAGWDKDKKDSIWKQIVKDKIHNQIAVLDKLQLKIPKGLYACEENVLPGDETNREALAAKLYFSSMFGNSFIRFAQNEINRALNYGYAIVRSSIDRIIAGYGYNTSIGIHHHSVDNRFNLSCDLMEPFRPYVDEIVYRNMEAKFDNAYKAVLVGMLKTTYMCGAMEFSLEDAMDCYANNVFRELRTATY